MRRYFNTEGTCFAEDHYMVPLDDRVNRIKENYISRGSYFVINRGRQYGKTTTLNAVASFLRNEFIVISLDFQGLGIEDFKNEQSFVKAFVSDFIKECRGLNIPETDELAGIINGSIDSMRQLFERLSEFCGRSSRKVILIIDEVDNASNYEVFVDFLGMMRRCYLERKKHPFFQSVILAGVYDIRNLKAKIRPDGEHQYNSPWNIAADFNVEMSFSPDDISVMLKEYEGDNHTGMDIDSMAQFIYDYTSGYPVLVSKICKIIDEKLSQTEEYRDKPAWCREGVDQAVRIMLNEKAPLFDNMARYLEQYEELRDFLENIIYRGEDVAASLDVSVIDQGMMFGYLSMRNGRVAVSNRIFEMRLMNRFAAEESIKSEAYLQGSRDKNQFIINGRLDMELVLQKFVSHYSDIYGDNDEKFVEKYGRKFFLLYLKPIINGTGNYYLEAETRDCTRTDVVVDYAGEQFVIEMKIWHGNEYHERGEKQLAEYLDYYHLEKGYLLSFCFNKNKTTGVRKVLVGDKMIVEAVV